MANPPLQGRVSFGDVENEELTLTSLGSRDAFAVALDLRGTVAVHVQVLLNIVAMSST